MTQSKFFIFQKDINTEAVEDGINRQILGYNEDLMLVKVSFNKGSVGKIHNHFHAQSSYIESGKFEVSINGEKNILTAGEAFFVPSDIPHGVICIEAGIIIDTFSPVRQDFLKQ